VPQVKADPFDIQLADDEDFADDVLQPLDDAGSKSAIFSALLAVAGLFLTVVLAMLGIVTSMDDDKAGATP
jgi:hypothetical protein